MILVALQPKPFNHWSPCACEAYVPGAPVRSSENQGTHQSGFCLSRHTSNMITGLQPGHGERSICFPGLALESLQTNTPSYRKQTEIRSPEADTTTTRPQRTQRLAQFLIRSRPLKVDAVHALLGMGLQPHTTPSPPRDNSQLRFRLSSDLNILSLLEAVSQRSFLAPDTT